jgi:hypothetical protein
MLEVEEAFCELKRYLEVRLDWGYRRKPIGYRRSA